MGKKKRIRPLAICVFRNNNRILVAEGYVSVKEEYFYRPLGGAIEFGETSVDTVCRELMEEINAEVEKESLKFLGAVENIFSFNGDPGHEIVLIYDGLFKQAKLYEQAMIIGNEVEINETFNAIWKNIDEFGDGKLILYPTGLLEMLI